MDFWLDRVMRQKLPLRFFNNKPGRYDLIAFSTFHWAVYMVISKCAYKEQGNEPYTYTWMLSTKSKLTDEDKKNIEDYRNILKNEFPKIHKEIYGKVERPRGRGEDKQGERESFHFQSPKRA